MSRRRGDGGLKAVIALKLRLGLGDEALRSPENRHAIDVADDPSLQRYASALVPSAWSMNGPIRPATACAVSSAVPPGVVT